MGNNAEEIVVAANGTVSVADVGTSAPTNATSALGAGWTGLGFVDPNGVTFTDSKTVTDVNAWQSFYPVRKLITAKEATLKFALEQWNAHTIQLAFGGGSVVASGGGYKFTPPQAETIDERAMCIDWQDGPKHYRLYVPRGLVADAVDTQLVRSSAANLPISFAATPQSTSDDAYEIFTDDPAWADYSE